MKLLQELIGGLDAYFVDKLSQSLTREQRMRIGERLKTWLTTEATLKPLPDLDDKIVRMSSDLVELANVLTFKMQQGEIVVMATGNAESTLQKLRIGTAWFNPCKDVVSLVISAVWES